MDRTPSKNVLGALLFLSTKTRLYITTAVSMIAKFQSQPGVKHWKIVKNVVRYLTGTVKFGILLPKASKDVEMICWMPAHRAQYLSKRRSRKAFLITINKGQLYWRLSFSRALRSLQQKPDIYALLHAIGKVKGTLLVVDELKAIDKTLIQVL